MAEKCHQLQILEFNEYSVWCLANRNVHNIVNELSEKCTELNQIVCKTPQPTSDQTIILNKAVKIFFENCRAIKTIIIKNNKNEILVLDRSNVGDYS